MCAGYGGLALAIEGPSKVDIQTEDVEDGTCRVIYCPTEPGNYIVSIRFAEEHVPGKKIDMIFKHTTSYSYTQLFNEGGVCVCVFSDK